MNRFAIVYTFLGILMAALVYIIGTPWISKRRKFAWDRSRRDRRSQSQVRRGLSGSS